MQFFIIAQRYVVKNMSRIFESPTSMTQQSMSRQSRWGSGSGSSFFYLEVDLYVEAFYEGSDVVVIAYVYGSVGTMYECSCISP